jgi:hypothetical protein
MRKKDKFFGVSYVIIEWFAEQTNPSDKGG